MCSFRESFLAPMENDFSRQRSSREASCHNCYQKRTFASSGFNALDKNKQTR